MALPAMLLSLDLTGIASIARHQLTILVMVSDIACISAVFLLIGVSGLHCQTVLNEIVLEMLG